MHVCMYFWANGRAFNGPSEKDRLFLPYLSETYFEVSLSLVITIEQLADVERDDRSETPSVCRMNVMSSQNTWPIHQFLNTTVDALLLMQYIPLTNRVRGPYRKLRTAFFPPRFMAQARSARAINRRGKTRIRNLRYGPRKRG